jgi:epoxyqueuosine reductase
VIEITSERLKQKAIDLGFTSVGICEAMPPPHLDQYSEWIAKGFHGSMKYLAYHLPLKAAPQTLLPAARSIVAVTLNYNQPNPVRNGQPRIARYALGRDYHKVLRGKLRKLELWLRAQCPEAETRACVDSAPIMERDYAQLAGLGWFGKNTCLIDSKRGSWFFIGLLLTSLPFKADVPAVGSCGSCRLCIDACPTGAIVLESSRWQVDARSCISYLTIEHSGPIELDTAGWTFGCDICQEVCPFNEVRASQPLRGTVTTEPDFLQARQWPNLEQLAQIGEHDWDELTRGSAVRRAGLEGIRRNARVHIPYRVR